MALCARTESELIRACGVLGASSPELLQAHLVDAPCDRTIEALRSAGISCEPVRLNQGDVFLDDRLGRSLDLVASYPHAEWGQLEQVGALWAFGDLEVTLHRAPPALGQHTVEVLTEVGMDPNAVATLLDRAVVAQSP
jgi:crotonobetainyl-CoA:carnitine CoA-transferase CaiB-like acyl-CoA transferase